MKKLPSKVKFYKKTPTFTKDTVPSGLLKNHSTKKGTWGKIIVIKGEIEYIIEVDPMEKVRLSETKFGIVEPEMPHHIKLVTDVEFFIEFYK